ncbi:hypothetical protein L228DRAFT_281926 [Xylona heveae TC161]|uniref:Uncharacterized protein n=1 Tax=Xylona heveae (strain CBS 132557 / TC161) TaxID=1328760 RepID=A0A165H9M0_XYLHT|nr:hypothetical protein L228DRAFT_281926 [Xylona heveae TC161]KZF23179.1 hypothetical protein L228DRAFT_281926 [Xylona heveae TC161]
MSFTATKLGFEQCANVAQISRLPQRLNARALSSNAKTKEPSQGPVKDESTAEATEKPEKKSIAEADDELRHKLEGRSGEGGSAGLEYEDGRPVSVKRSVRNNMFRYI